MSKPTWRIAVSRWVLIGLPFLLVPVPTAIAQPIPPAIDTQPASDLLAGAQRALRSGNYQRALELSDEALYSGANKAQIFMLKAQVYAQLHDVDSERQALQSALTLDDTLYLPRLILARIELDRGLWQKAAELYQQAIEANPTHPLAHLRLTDLYQTHNQPRRALQVLQQAVETNPREVRLLIALGDAYHRRHLLEQAEATYGRIIALDDSTAQVKGYRRLAELYTDVGQYGEAFGCYAKAAELEEGSAEVDSQGYEQVFAAADRAARQALDEAWETFSAYIQGDEQVAREQAYIAVQQATTNINQIKQSAAQVEAPANLQAIHSQRRLFYSVAYEAAFSAQMYLDTGDQQLRQTADQRRMQARQEYHVLLDLSPQ